MALWLHSPAACHLSQMSYPGCRNSSRLMAATAHHWHQERERGQAGAIQGENDHHAAITNGQYGWVQVFDWFMMQVVSSVQGCHPHNIQAQAAYHTAHVTGRLCGDLLNYLSHIYQLVAYSSVALKLSGHDIVNFSKVYGSTESYRCKIVPVVQRLPSEGNLVAWLCSPQC